MRNSFSKPDVTDYRCYNNSLRQFVKFSQGQKSQAKNYSQGAISRFFIGGPSVSVCRSRVKRRIHADCFNGTRTGGCRTEYVANAASHHPPARVPCGAIATMGPATTRPPPLTDAEPARQRVTPDAALVEFVKALARQQALEDHLRETGQDEFYDPRCDLRPL